MNNIMYFELNKNKYLIYIKDDKINIARIVKRKMVLPTKPDSGIIREVIDLMCNPGVNKELIKSKIKLLCSKSIKVKVEENNTTLNFLGETKDNFIKNAAILDTKGVTLSKAIIIIILSLVLIVGIILGVMHFIQ